MTYYRTVLGTKTSDTIIDLDDGTWCSVLYTPSYTGFHGYFLLYQNDGVNRLVKYVYDK